MEVEVRLVSRRPAPLVRSPAAAYVLTADDLRRSGATTLPDALRLVPGMHVAQMDGNKWALTSRGFTDVFANKLLVLVDGRSVYNTLFSGVLWEAQDLVFDEAERIEVVRGPGASTWGANAVNGVINIVTRPADQQPGGRVELGTGTGAGAERFTGTVRYAGRAGGAAYRVFARGFQRDPLRRAGGGDADDGWHNLRAGLRADWRLDADTDLMLETQAYRGRLGQTLTLVRTEGGDVEALEDEAPLSGGHALLRWRRSRSTSREQSVQAYFDQAQRRDLPLTSLIRTADVEVQERRVVAGRHDLVWGGGVRVVWDDFRGSFAFALEPPQRTMMLYSLFAQNDLPLLDERLLLSVGARLEHNHFTGLEWQPNARLLWAPATRHTLWASAGRAVRIPNRVDVDERYVSGVVRYEGLPPAVVAVVGNPDYQSEELVVGVDAGYRLHGDGWAVDLAAYHGWYDDLRTSEPQLPGPHPDLPGFLLVPVLASNLQKGVAYGAELAVDWLPAPGWQLRGGSSYEVMDLRLKAGSLDAVADGFEGENPDHLFFLRSSWAPARQVDVDLVTRAVSAAPVLDVAGYVELDARLAWRFARGWEIDASGRNLLSRRRLEFRRINEFALPGRIGRSGLLRLRTTF